MSESRFVELRGQRIEITDARRQAILEEMPEIAWIANEELRAGVVDAWAPPLRPAASSGSAT